MILNRGFLRNRPSATELNLTGLLALLLLAGCLSNKPDDKRQPALATGDTLSSNPTLRRDTVDSSLGSSSNASAQYRDSANVFDPDGYFITTDPLTINGHMISSLQLHTVDFNYGGGLHYERPKLLQPPEVVVSLSNPKGANDSSYRCTAPVIIPDSLSVRCVGTSVGDVAIDGHFLDKSGWYWNKVAYENNPTVLLIARVVVTKGGKIVRDAVRRFTYAAGE